MPTDKPKKLSAAQAARLAQAAAEAAQQAAEDTKEEAVKGYNHAREAMKQVRAEADVRAKLLAPSKASGERKSTDKGIWAGIVMVVLASTVLVFATLSRPPGAEMDVYTSRLMAFAENMAYTGGGLIAICVTGYNITRAGFKKALARVLPSQ